MTFYQRLERLVGDIKQNELAKIAGVKPASVTEWKKEGTTPRTAAASKIASHYKISLQSLITDEAPSEIPPKILDLAQKIFSLSSEDREEIMLLVEHKLKKQEKRGNIMETLTTNETVPGYMREKVIDFSRYAQDEIPMDTVKFMGWEMTFLPYFGKTAAGEPININIYTGEGMPFPRPLLKGKAEGYFIVKIEGSSMTEAGIHTGDYVIIHRAEEPQNGKIMLVRYENSSTLKRIKIKETKKNGREVYLHWEDGSGDFKLVDATEYEIQGEFYRNLGQ